ncbi:hypothetical protein ACNOYE_24230 [Nannocystaceae bacterium ST9]
MPDDHASSSDSPRRDESSATGAPKPLHGEPPTLPPFSSDGPRPLTIAGMPAVDVFGSDDLFADVPALGARAPSGAVPVLPGAPATKLAVPAPPKLAVPPPPKLGAPKLAAPPKLATTGAPIGALPQSRIETVSGPAPKPVETKPVETKPVETKLVESRPESKIIEGKPVANKRKASGPKPAAGSDLAKAIALSPDLEFELSVGLIDPAEVLRAAREREASAPVERTETPGPIAMALADAKPEPKLDSVVGPKPTGPKLDSVVGPKPTEPKLDSVVGPKPTGPKLDSVVGPKPLAGKSKSDDIDNLVTAPFPSLATLAAQGAVPEEIDDRQSPPPRAAEPRDAIVATITESHVEPPATLEPVIIERPTSVDSAIPPTFDSSAPSESRSHESSGPSQDTSTSVDGSMSSKPANPMAPPAPRSVIDDRPRLGVPYEPPAVIVRLHEPSPTPEATQPSTEIREDTNPRGPAALPRPGRSPMPPARAPAPSPDAGKVVPLPVLARPEGAPRPIGPQDTGALIDGMADELVAKTHHPPPTKTLIMEVPDDEPAPAANTGGRRKLVIGFVLFAIAASLLVALLPPDDSSSDEVAANDDPPSEPVEPKPVEPIAGPDVLAQADPTPSPDSGEPEVEAPPSEPEPGPEPGSTSKPKSGKPKSSKPAPAPEPTPTATKPKPKPEPKPEPVASKPEPAVVDNRDAKQLYDAAKSAYDKGKAGEAYKLAAASYKKGAKPKTAELMLLAACKLGDAGKAKSALDKVAGVRKPPLRKQCKSMGVTI